MTPWLTRWLVKSRLGKRKRKRKGWRAVGMTLVELMMALVVVGLLAAVALPSYQAYVQKAKISNAKKDILEYSMLLERYFTHNNTYPDTLAELGNVRPDPWGTPYQYLSMEGASVGKKRKDKSLHPLNSDYDLYSMGPDGDSQTPLTAKASRDDIIRANNGGFIGVAEDY